MSFPKAELKRFNDKTGCAPPVGAYDPKDDKRETGATIDKSQRFKHPKDMGGPCGLDGTSLSFSNPRLSSTPQKKGTRLSNYSSGSESSLQNTTNKQTAKKPVPNGQQQSAKMKELELEVRRLLREKTEQDRQLAGLRQERERLEGRLTAANAERTSSLARTAQLDHDARQSHRSLEALTKQMSGAETAGRRREEKQREDLQGLQQQIVGKEQEIQTTHRHVAAALLQLLRDAQECAASTQGLTALMHKLDISSDGVQGSEEEKGEESSTEAGKKDIDMQIRKTRRLIKRVSGCVSTLAESGVSKVDALQVQIQEECGARLLQVSTELAEAHAAQQELQQQLTQQQQQLEEKALELQQLEEQQCQALRQKSQCEATSADFAEQLREAETRLTQAEKDLLHKQVQHEDALLQLEREAESGGRVKEELQESQAAVARLEQEAASLQGEVERLAQRVSQLQHSRDNLEVESDHLSLANKELEFKGHLLSDALQSIKGDVYDASATGTPVKAKQLLFEESAEKACLLDERAALEEERIALVADKVQVEREKGALQDSITQLQQENEVLNDSIRSLTSKYQNVIRELESDVRAEREGRFQSETHFSVAESERAQVEAELQTTQLLNKDLVQSLNVFQEEVSHLRNSQQDSLREVESLRNTNTNLLTDLQTQEQASQQDMEVLQHEVESLRKTNTDLSGLLTDLQTRELASQQDMEILQHAMESLKNTNADLSALVQDLEKQEQASQRDMQTLECTNAELSVAVSDLHLRLADSERSFGSAQERLGLLEVEVTQHRIANEALQGKVASLTASFDTERAELNEKCCSMVQERQRLADKHKEDLVGVRKAVALDRQSSEVQQAELTHKLERAQTFNGQMKEELKRLLKEKEKQKHESVAEISALRENVSALEENVAALEESDTALRERATSSESRARQASSELQSLRQETSRLQESVAGLEAGLAHVEEERSVEEAVARELRSHLEESEQKLRDVELENEALEKHLDRVHSERSLLESDSERQLQTLQEAALDERTEFERIISEMSEKIQQLEEEQENQDQDPTGEWRQKYEDLFARVEPFLEQLEAFAAERNLLVGRSETAESEMSRMMDKYAKLLGHQNQKQKIQYINKLKEDFMTCRKEKEALKEKNNKQLNTISKLEKKLAAVEGRKTFDPTQAFKHVAAKTHDLPRSPLRQTNK